MTTQNYADADRWLQPGASDADLAHLGELAQSSVLASRAAAGWKYLAMATTVEGYGDFDIHVLPHVESGDPEGQDLVPAHPDAVPAVVIPLGKEDLDGADAHYDAALGAYGWERVGDWEPCDFGGIVEVRRVNRGGRPGFEGTRVNAKLPEHLLAAVDKDVAALGVARPEAIRRRLQFAYNAADRDRLAAILQAIDGRWGEWSYEERADYLLQTLNLTAHTFEGKTVYVWNPDQVVGDLSKMRWTPGGAK